MIITRSSMSGGGNSSVVWCGWRGDGMQSMPSSMKCPVIGVAEQQRR